jgi:hypothetical protein
VLFMYSCTDIICSLVADAPEHNRVRRVTEVERALRVAANDYHMLGHRNLERFAADLDRLRKQCTDGWDTIKPFWRQLPFQYQRHYIWKVFEHEKGYPEIVQSAKNYVRPDSLTLESALISILMRDVKEDIFTARNDGKTKSNGERIKVGWFMAKKDEKKIDFMWCQILCFIGQEYAIEGQLDPILTKIRQDRKTFITQLSNYIPYTEVTDFLDGRVMCTDGKVRSVAERAWGEIMGY